MKPSNILLFVAATVVLLWFVHQTSAALAPFMLAAVAAYIVSPVAAKLEQWMPSAAAAALLVLLLLVVLLTLPLALAPIIVKQVSSLIAVLPDLAARAGDWLGEAQPHVIEQLRALNTADLAKHAAGLFLPGGAAEAFFGFFGKGISAVAGFFAFVLITPLAGFYFIRDRRIIASAWVEFQPPRWRTQLSEVAHDLDSVLGEFLHGQLSVIAVMSILYSMVLWVGGLEYALTIGVVSGILVFIPYVGFMLGLVLATIAGLGQFESWSSFMLIWLMMGIGTLLESFFITPWLVGDRIGLHPMLVLLSLFVMGSLLGFVGVLAALPLAAIALVLCRHLRRHYINSEFYGRR